MGVVGAGGTASNLRWAATSVAWKGASARAAGVVPWAGRLRETSWVKAARLLVLIMRATLHRKDEGFVKPAARRRFVDMPREWGMSL